MRLTCFATILFTLAPGGLIHAHELEPGQILFSRSAGGQRIETDNLSVALAFAGSDQIPQYRITLKTQDPPLENANLFEQDGGPDPFMSAINWARYCGQSIIFVTIRYPIPPLADGRVFRLETQAFLSKSLEYLATAHGPFENITPLEGGVDLGFPYEMPQKFVVECSGSTASHDFEFSITDRAQK